MGGISKFQHNNNNNNKRNKNNRLIACNRNATFHALYNSLCTWNDPTWYDQPCIDSILFPFKLLHHSPLCSHQFPVSILFDFISLPSFSFLLFHYTKLVSILPYPHQSFIWLKITIHFMFIIKLSKEVNLGLLFFLVNVRWLFWYLITSIIDKIKDIMFLKGFWRLGHWLIWRKWQNFMVIMKEWLQ